MDARAEMPGLAFPFAVVGAAAGWLSVDLLDNPLLGFTPSDAGVLAAACTALVGAAVGRVLHARCAPADDWVDPSATWVQLGIAVLLGGAVSGAVVGVLAFQNGRGLTSGTLAGLGGAVAFLPVCALVLAAGRRAARARLGSLVAGADRREVWAILAAALAVMTVAALPDWIAGDAPTGPIGMVVAALGVTLALLALDLRARSLVARAEAATAAMELRDGPAGAADASAPALDLGLGDEVHARVVHGAAAYRGGARVVALLLGSPERAGLAMRRALVKKGIAAAVVLAALAGHALMVRAPTAVLFHEILCERRSAFDCAIAAAMLREGAPEHGDLVRAVVLGARACEGFDKVNAEGCRTTAELLERASARPDDARQAEHFRELACEAGDHMSCRVLARRIAAGDSTALRPTWRKVALLQLACEGGDHVLCDEAYEARRAAWAGR
jgi:hypothetical protein